MEIPSGRLRNASLASSDRRPKGAVSFWGKFANMEEGLRLSMAVCSSSRTWSLRVPTPGPNFSQGHGSGLLTAELPDIES